MPKYVVNNRGRAMELSDEEGVQAIAQGFIEIPIEAYQKGKYFPEYDKGQDKRFEPLLINTQPPPAKGERKEFTTTIV